MENHPSLRLDQQKVKDFVNVLQSLKADTIVSDTKSAAEYKKYRLNKPDIIVNMDYAPATVDHKDNKTENWKFWVGQEKENTVFLRSDNTNSIYKAAKYKVSGLYKTLDDFRNREFPFAFDVSQVEKMQLKKGSDSKPTVVVKKNDKWAALDNSLKVDNAEVEKVLEGLRALRAEEFVKSHKLDMDKNKVVLSDVKNKDVFSLQWGDKIKKGGESFYYAKTNLADETFTLKASLVDNLVKSKIIDKPSNDKKSKKEVSGAGDKDK